MLLQADQPIGLQYSHQIKLFENRPAEKHVSRSEFDEAKKFYFPFANLTTVFFYINVPKK